MVTAESVDFRVGVRCSEAARLAAFAACITKQNA
jgi:hypothetical protein